MQTVCNRTSGMVAVTRELSLSIAECQLTYLTRAGIDYEAAARQHREYVSILQQLGLEVIVLPSEASMPDAVFVEDTALLLDEVAVLTRPCSVRQRETLSVKMILERYRQVIEMECGSSLEGGDVIRNGRYLYVGQSTRTNRAGFEELCSIAAPYSYRVIPVDVRHCLHLSTAVSYLGDDTFLLNPDWVDKSLFAQYSVLETPPAEPWAANVLSIGGSIIIPSAFPATCELLERAGHSVKQVVVDELLKAEAGVTCMALVFHAAASSAGVLSPERPSSSDKQDEMEPAFQVHS